jgi:hypothetical protein
MSHIASIGAGLYTDLSVYTDTSSPVAPSVYSAYTLKSEFDTLFIGSDFTRIRNVREFPAIGTPPNITNVPVYGQKQTQQIQAQSDAPSMELQLNFVASDWAEGTVLGDMVGDGIAKAFRFALLNSNPTGGYASSAGGLGTTQNSYWYFIGKVEALLVTPSLSDSNTATVTISVQSDFFGAFTT